QQSGRLLKVVDKGNFVSLIRLSLELKRRIKMPINHCVLHLFLSNIKGWTVFAQPLSTIKKDEKPLAFLYVII
ncbi:hypothetical protein, partial [Streptococcus parasanguinis]|uniref:hypothetical protein n=1 Tax=Streptococcus parasanguinis TaxID=1318 RepID=UPI0009BC1A1F